MERWPRGLRPFAALAMTLAWPIGSFIEALQACRYLLPDRLGGRSRLSAFFWAWVLALRHNVPPVEAFSYRLYEPDAADPDQWWYSWEAASLARSLSDCSARELASDKVAFADWCQAHGLRSIQTLASAGRAGWICPFQYGRPPPRDLLLKPCRGHQGRGVEVWRWAEGHYSHAGRRHSAEDFASHILRRAASEEPILVQPYVAPHPALQGIAGTGMPAARLVTARWPDGRAELSLGMLQSPLPGEVVSNAGPFRLIDVVTGEVSEMTVRQSSSVFAVSSGEGFEQIRLPFWTEAAAMLVRAHAQYPGRAPIIGWDLLFDAEGPLICEANLEISYYFFQQAKAQPITYTAIGRVVEAWL